MLCGLDQLSSGEFSSLRRRLRSERVAVLTHAAAVDRRGRHVLIVLEELGVKPSLVFAPEHGLESHAQAEVQLPSIEGATASSASTKVVSLYGDSKGSLKPSAESLAEADLLLIDLVDIGARYYTYVWTALLAARAARDAGVHCVVLDRPNPISGNPASLEGKPQQEGFLSFVGLECIPIRHALTIGEILTYFLERDGAPLGADGALSAVPMRGWERHRTAAAWDRPFVMPSPNMPTLETATVYPGGCLVEGTNLSEGRGTTVPFQLVGAPFLDGRALAAALEEIGTPGAMIRPVVFQPQFEKHAGAVCSGVMVHVTNPAMFKPVSTYLRLITLAHHQAPSEFAFRTEPYEFENDIPAFDLLTGSDAARAAIGEGAPAEDVADLVAPVGPEWAEALPAMESRTVAARA
jgi:uncharacterized protein YbbC (DUF1343 family)